MTSRLVDAADDELVVALERQAARDADLRRRCLGRRYVIVTESNLHRRYGQPLLAIVSHAEIPPHAKVVSLGTVS